MAEYMKLSKMEHLSLILRWGNEWLSPLKLNTNLDEQLMNFNGTDYAEAISNIHYYLEEAIDLPSGWLNIPYMMDSDVIAEIMGVSFEIRKKADVLVVVGIGGSYLGAKAIKEALSPYFKPCEEGIEVLFVGHNLSGRYMNQVIERLQGKEFYINVISKSGSTMEVSIAFRILRQLAQKKYGTEANERIIVTTDSEKGSLKNQATNHGYRQFHIPSNIGGRYSVLSPVGLLPIAVSGVDVVQLLEGAKSAAWALKEADVEKNLAYRYAMYRHALYTKGYKVELLASFEPALAYLHEWWKQLFGESEGKAKKGLFPASVSYSTDLHSLGQFVQEGNPILFETFLSFNEMEEDYSIPIDLEDEDALNKVSQYTLNEINAFTKQGTFFAHSEGGVPIIEIEIKRLDAFHMGYLLFFFMKSCAMSAYLLGVFPFDQPGVEAYKKKIAELLITETIVK